ncbi:MAG: hypothetical protein IJ835_05740, partial [Muribaculaceae bacterium]|nr:hypothetical protein [Muribaculaceae bacterium]
NNPTLRSAGDAGWGRRYPQKPSPDGRPPSSPAHADCEAVATMLHPGDACVAPTPTHAARPVRTGRRATPIDARSCRLRSSRHHA